MPYMDIDDGRHRPGGLTRDRTSQLRELHWLANLILTSYFHWNTPTVAGVSHCGSKIYSREIHVDVLNSGLADSRSRIRAELWVINHSEKRQHRSRLKHL